MRSKFALLILISPLLFTSALAFQTSVLTKELDIIVVDVSVYCDFNCSDLVTSIEWETLKPGDNQNITVYIRNEGNTNVTLSLGTENWLPSSAEQYFSLIWNYLGETLEPSQFINTTLTLSVSPEIENIDAFSFDFAMAIHSNGLTFINTILSFGLVSNSRVHNLDTRLNYTTIQEAIDAPETLDKHRIFVEEGIYYENLVMNKSLMLIGENSSTTIIDGNGQYACIVHIVADDVVMSGFTMRNNRDFPGMYLENSSCCVIRHNIFIDIPRYAIYTTSAKHCRIEANNFSSSNGNWGRGIQLQSSDNNTIVGNQIMTHNDQYCIWLRDSSDCKIHENWLANGVDGLMIEYSYGCLFKKNLIENCERAIDIGWAVRGEFVANLVRSNYYGVEGEGDECIFYHNNFVNNSHQAYVSVGEGDWNNSLEGNYWDDYTGSDSNHDGIGDVPYLIERSPNADHHPLMGFFSDFNATTEHHVQTICNSSISGFQFNGTAIDFDVSGDDETSGFCRICIPTVLMNDTFTVFVNGTQVDYNLLLCSSSTHNYLYFTYNHSTQEIVIIPEFPSFLILPLFLIATLLAVIVEKKEAKSDGFYKR